MRLSPVNDNGVAMLQILQLSDVGKVGEGGSGGEGAIDGQLLLVMEAEQWLEQSDICASWFSSNAACWCEEETDIVHTELTTKEETMIPETPSPVKRVVEPSRSVCVTDNAQPRTHAETQAHMQSHVVPRAPRVVPPLPTVLHDLNDHKALLLVTIRSSSTNVLTSSFSSAPSSSANTSVSKVQRALLSGLAPNGRVGFLQFVTDRVCESPVEPEPCKVEEDKRNEQVLPNFGSHMMEEWAWKPCPHLLELGKPCSPSASADVQNATDASAAARKDMATTEKTATFASHVYTATAAESRIARAKLLKIMQMQNSSAAATCSSSATVVSSDSIASAFTAACATASGSNSSGVDGDASGGVSVDTDGGYCAETIARMGGEKIEAATVEDALEQLHNRYTLMLGTYTCRNPLSFFAQVIPEFNAVLETLQASSKERSVDERVELGDGEKMEATECGMTGDGTQGEDGGSQGTLQGTGVGEQQALGKSADEGRVVEGVRREIVSLITSKWIEKPKAWNMWLGMGMAKDECKRQHEFQALLRLYLSGRPGKAHKDPIENATMKNVKIALGRVFVNQTHAQKLSYMEQTLTPLCCTYLPRTLENLVEYFGLSVEEEAGAISSSSVVQTEQEVLMQQQPQQGSSARSSTPHLTASGGGALSALSAGTSSRTPQSWSDRSRDVSNLSRAKSSMSRQQSSSSAARAGARSGNGGRSSVMGNMLVEKKNSRGVLGSGRMQEMLIPKQRKPQKSVRSGSGATSSSVRGNKGSDVKNINTKSHAKNGNAMKGTVAKSNEMKSNARQSTESLHVPTNSHQLLSTPARCKVATILVPETPETKMADKAAPSSSDKRPPRMSALPPVEMFDSISSSTSTSAVAAAAAAVSTSCDVVQTRSVRTGLHTHTQRTPELLGYPKSPLHVTSEHESPPRMGGLFCAEVHVAAEASAVHGAVKVEGVREQVTRRGAGRIQVQPDKTSAGKGGSCASDSVNEKDSQLKQVIKGEKNRISEHKEYKSMPVVIAAANSAATGAATRPTTRGGKSSVLLSCKSHSASNEHNDSRNEVEVPGDEDDERDEEDVEEEEMKTEAGACKSGAVREGEGAAGDMPFYKYAVGDLVLVSTEHVMRKMGKKKKELYSVKSEAQVVGPFKVLLVTEDAGKRDIVSGSVCKYKLNAPAVMCFASNAVDASMLSLYKTKDEVLSAQPRPLAPPGVFYTELVLDVEMRPDAFDGKVFKRHALVEWQGDHCEEEKYSWEPIESPHLAGTPKKNEGLILESNVDLRHFQSRQKVAWAPSLATTCNAPSNSATSTATPICTPARDLRSKMCLDHARAERASRGGMVAIEAVVKQEEAVAGAATRRGCRANLSETAVPSLVVSSGREVCKRQASATHTDEETQQKRLRSDDARPRIDSAQATCSASTSAPSYDSVQDAGDRVYTASAPASRRSRVVRESTGGIETKAPLPANGSGAKQAGVQIKREKVNVQNEANKEAAQDAAAIHNFEVGQTVWALFEGMGPADKDKDWYAASITQKLDDSKFLLDWVDGDMTERTKHASQMEPWTDMTPKKKVVQRQESVQKVVLTGSAMQCKANSSAGQCTAAVENDAHAVDQGVEAAVFEARDVRKRCAPLHFKPGGCSMSATLGASSTSKVHVKEEPHHAATHDVHASISPAHAMGAPESAAEAPANGERYSKRARAGEARKLDLDHVPLAHLDCAHPTAAVLHEGDLVLLRTLHLKSHLTPSPMKAKAHSEPAGVNFSGTPYIGPFKVLQGVGKRAGGGGDVGRAGVHAKYRLEIPRGNGKKGVHNNGDLGVDGDDFEVGMLTLFRTCAEWHATLAENLEVQKEERRLGVLTEDLNVIDFVLGTRMMRVKDGTERPCALIAWRGACVYRCICVYVCVCVYLWR